MKLPLNIDIQQIFLHMFNFIILIGGLYFLLYKPIKDFMDKRAAYYSNLEKETKDRLTEANLLKEQYTKQKEEVEQEIAAEKLQASRDLERQIAEELDRTKKQAVKVLAEAQREAEEEKSRILREARKEITDMAAAATGRLLFASAPEAYDVFLSSAEEGADDDEC